MSKALLLSETKWKSKISQVRPLTWAIFKNFTFVLDGWWLAGSHHVTEVIGSDSGAAHAICI